MVKIKNLRKTELRNVKITCRTFSSYAKWMERKKISPSKLLNTAIEELKKKDSIFSKIFYK